MERLANKLSEKIASQMKFDEDKKEVIAYGLTAIFQMIVIALVISVIGIIFGFFYESMIIFIGVGIIRKSTGGAHSRTMFGCLIFSILSIVLLSSLSRNVLNIQLDILQNIGISFVVFIFCFIIFYIRVPVDSPNKPIVKPEKIKRLRRQSFTILIIFSLLSVVFVLLTPLNSRFYSISVSIRLTMLWQLLTLTKFGGKLIYKIDSIFSKIEK